MKYPYSKSSKAKMQTIDERLNSLLNIAANVWDITVISGRRGKTEQNKLFKDGKSKLEYPDSKHNTNPLSMAVDIAPYMNGRMLNGDEKSDIDTMTMFAGFFIGLAALGGIELRWGGDFNMDRDLSNDNWDDLFHYELVE